MQVVPIYSINYGFLPTSMHSKKVLWVQLKFPAEDYGVGTGSLVRIVSSSPTSSMPRGDYYVRDAVGTRLVLELHKPSSEWGYVTRDHEDLPGVNRDWNYGSGEANAFLTIL